MPDITQLADLDTLIDELDTRITSTDLPTTPAGTIDTLLTCETCDLSLLTCTGPED